MLSDSLGSDLPGATSLRARDLKIGSYRFTVKAQTAVGECGTTSLTVTLNSLSMFYFCLFHFIFRPCVELYYLI